MGEIVAFQRQSAAAEYLAEWKPLPGSMTPVPRNVEAAAKTELENLKSVLVLADEKETAVHLDRLFSTLAPPPEAAMREWFRQLKYPGWALEEAVTNVIRTHKYPSPPSIADFIEKADAALAPVKFRQGKAEWVLTQVRWYGLEA